MSGVRAEVFGPYLLYEQLGEGGMGVVYRAEDTRRPGGPALAVKRVRGDLLRHPSARRFLREVRAVRRLAHPNVVAMFDDGDIDGEYFISMELMGGPSLIDCMQSGPMSLNALSSLAIGAGAALAAAHRADVVHRDIKPGNILLRGPLVHPGVVAICDFGLAKLLDEAGSKDPTTMEGAVLGTPAYMAPEQALGHQVDARADIYALGALLFEAAAGRRPFEADTPMALMMKHATEPPPLLGPLAPSLPSNICRVIERSLVKVPDERLSSASEIVEAFEPYMPTSVPGFSGPSSLDLPSLAPLAPKRRDRGLVFAGGLAAAFVLLGGAAMSVHRATPERAPVEEIAEAAPEPPGMPEAAPVLEPSSAEEAAPSEAGPERVEAAPPPDPAQRRPRTLSPNRRSRRKARPTKMPSVRPAPRPAEGEAPARREMTAKVESSAGQASLPLPSSTGDVAAPPAEAAPVRVRAEAALPPARPKPLPDYRVAGLKVVGGVSRGRVSRLLEGRLAEMRDCLGQVTEQVEVRVELGFSGRARAVDVRGAEGSASRCLEGQARGLRFPQPDTGSTVIAWTMTRVQGD